MSITSHITSMGKVFKVGVGAGLIALTGLNHSAAQSAPQAQSQPNRDTKIEVDLGPQQTGQQQTQQRSEGLNPFIATILAVQTESAAELSQVVAKHAESSKIGQFAEQAAGELQTQAERLRNFASIADSQQNVATQGATSQGTDLSAAAQDIGQDIRERVQERRARTDNTTTVEQPVADARGIRRDRGEQDRPRVVLPAIRKNLPQIMELAGEAIEQGIKADAQPRSRVELLVGIAEETLNTKEKELAKYQGEAYEQAYLGMLVDAGLEIEAAAIASEPMASGALKEALKDVQQTAAELTDQARRQMSQSTDIARRDEPRSDNRDRNSSTQQATDGQKLP